MTISSTTNRDDYVGNGAVNEYDYTFRILADTDLLVTVAHPTTGAETTLVLNTDYTVDGVGDESGGSITLLDDNQAWLTNGFLTTDYALTLRRVRPLTQTTDIRNQGPGFPEIHEDAFDHLVMVAQQQQDELDRSIKLPETEGGADGSTTFPTAAARADKFLAFDENGDFVAVVGVVPGEITVSEYMETLMNAADAAAAKVILEIGASVIPAGTLMLFFMAAAPAGWTKKTDHDGKALRVVSGAGGGAGGSQDPGSAISLAHDHAVNAHSHTMSHRHTTPLAWPNSVAEAGSWGQGSQSLNKTFMINLAFQGDTASQYWLKTMLNDTANSGNASPDTDSKLTDVSLAYINVIVCEKD